MDPFRAFIQSQLKIAKINSEYRNIFTNEDGMKLFLKAVTHPTYDSNNNYEILEFIGDGQIKAILSQYIPRRFPDLATKGEGALSKTRRMLEQRKTLSDFALERGFWDYVRADEDTKTKKRKETLEDVYEAFIGALVEIVDNKVKNGLGYTFAYNYVKASLDDLEIDLGVKALDDPITRLNELFKSNELLGSKPPLKWGDAAYESSGIHVPKVDNKPTDATKGDVIFSTKDKIPFIFDGSKWITVQNIPLMKLQAYPGIEPITDEDGRYTNMQLLWYAGAYGFPSKLGKESDGSLEKVKPAQILADPGTYGAAVIGQGLHFKKAEAKKIAADKAIAFLEKRGYSK